MSANEWLLAGAVLALIVCIVRQLVAVMVPPPYTPPVWPTWLPSTWDDFTGSPVPMCMLDVPLRDPCGDTDVADIYNMAGAVARMNHHEFRTLQLTPCQPNRTRWGTE